MDHTLPDAFGEGPVKTGPTIKKPAQAELLHELGYSLKANKKTIEDVSHPDRDQ